MVSNIAAAVFTKTIENVVNLSSYTIVIHMNNDNYSFELLTNYEFIAGSKEAALKVAAPMLKELIPYVEVYYDSNQPRLSIQILENKYFDSVELRKFEIHEDSLNDLVINGGALSPAKVLSCYSFVTKEEFCDHLKMTFKSSNIIKFEAVGYGIALIMTSDKTDV